MPWLNPKKKCEICQDKYPKDTAFHEMRLNTQSGLVSLEICEKCADFFDKSADIMRKREDVKDQSV